jgi:hypothetical protein
MLHLASDLLEMVLVLTWTLGIERIIISPNRYSGVGGSMMDLSMTRLYLGIEQMGKVVEEDRGE